MICSNCGKDNKDTAKFCVACGTKLEVEAAETAEYFEKEATVVLKDYDSYKEGFENHFENVSEGSFDNQFDRILESDFENEETVILQDFNDYDDSPKAEEPAQDLYDFENEKTVILQDNTDYDPPFEDEHTVVLDGLLRSKAHADESDSQTDVPEVPDFHYEAEVYKAPPTQFEQDTAYINHLRALKQLMDDGIITEEEFTRKKQQILGI
jgi:hypothetical protein